jgi:hypothetical protein
MWRLVQCSGCGRGGLAQFHDSGNHASALLGDFHPTVLPSATLPTKVPAGILNEYREAELCAASGALRGASVLLRSTLEKTFHLNGYTKGGLNDRIDRAAADGVITAARKQKAHEDVRVLGNEVVHEEWRPVSPEEVEQALHYVQRILEDFYDDRATVESLLAKRAGPKE